MIYVSRVTPDVIEVKEVTDSFHGTVEKFFYYDMTHRLVSSFGKKGDTPNRPMTQHQYEWALQVYLPKLNEAPVADAVDFPPTPWTIRDCGDANMTMVLSADSGKWVFVLQHNGENPARVQNAIAKRIIACVNSSAGVSTEELEQAGPTAISAANKIDKYKRAVVSYQLDAKEIERSKDKLAAQLRNLITATKEIIAISDRKHDAWDHAKAVISDIEGGVAADEKTDI